MTINHPTIPKTLKTKIFFVEFVELKIKTYLCAMIITNKEILEKYSQKHVIVKNPIEKWTADVTVAQWKSLNDLRLSYPSADYVGNGRVVFNIKGTDYRLIVIIIYVVNVVEVRWIGTHAEYDKIKDCSII